MMSAEKQSYLSGRESYILIKGYKTKKTFLPLNNTPDELYTKCPGI